MFWRPLRSLRRDEGLLTKYLGQRHVLLLGWRADKGWQRRGVQCQAGTPFHVGVLWDAAWFTCLLQTHCENQEALAPSAIDWNLNLYGGPACQPLDFTYYGSLNTCYAGNAAIRCTTFVVTPYASGELGFNCCAESPCQACTEYIAVDNTCYNSANVFAYPTFTLFPYNA